MDTQILQPTDLNIMRCATCLRKGGLVAFPTETVYALGAVATDPIAVGKVYDVKGRDARKPLIVAVAKKNMIGTVVKSIPPKAQTLIDTFMPGALTLILDRGQRIPDAVTCGGDSVAVRIPNNPVALKLIECVGKPVVVPSANTSNKPSPTCAAHVLDDLNGKIEYILDGGHSDIGIESTIIDMRSEPPTVLRSGGVPISDIESAIGHVEFVRESPLADSGYMPCAEVLFSAYYDGMIENIRAKYDEMIEKGKNAVILCLDGNAEQYEARNIYTVGKDYAEYAHNLFASLRRADSEHFDLVIAEGVKPDGIGTSLINRLIKISGGQII